MQLQEPFVLRNHRFVQLCQRSVGCPTLILKLASFHHFCYNNPVSRCSEDNMTVKPVLPIKVLLADDSEIMREAIKKLLVDEPRIQIVGEASSFPAAMQAVADFKPELLLLDLHLPQKRDLQPPLVKAQLNCIKCTLAISFANDEEAQSLAASYGAVALLDKMSLYTELLPAILQLTQLSAHPSPNIDPKPSREAASLGISE
jgi:CheY-like chemotaxis protein